MYWYSSLRYNWGRTNLAEQLNVDEEKGEKSDDDSKSGDLGCKSSDHLNTIGEKKKTDQWEVQERIMIEESNVEQDERGKRGWFCFSPPKHLSSLQRAFILAKLIHLIPILAHNPTPLRQISRRSIRSRGEESRWGTRRGFKVK